MLGVVVAFGVFVGSVVWLVVTYDGCFVVCWWRARALSFVRLVWLVVICAACLVGLIVGCFVACRCMWLG